MVKEKDIKVLANYFMDGIDKLPHTAQVLECIVIVFIHIAATFAYGLKMDYDKIILEFNKSWEAERKYYKDDLLEN